MNITIQYYWAINRTYKIITLHRSFEFWYFQYVCQWGRNEGILFNSMWGSIWTLAPGPVKLGELSKKQSKHREAEKVEEVNRGIATQLIWWKTLKKKKKKTLSKLEPKKHVYLHVLWESAGPKKWISLETPHITNK